MAPQIAHFALILAFTLAATQAVVTRAGVKRDEAVMMSFGSSAALGQFLFIALAFLCLASARPVTDTSLAVALIVSGAGAGLALGLAKLPARRLAQAIALQGLVSLGVLGYALFSAQPFARVASMPLSTVEPAIAGIALGPSHKSPSQSAAKFVDRLPASFDLPPLRDGDKGFAAADLKGRAVVLNVFASWCPVCKEEHPTLLRLAEKSPVPIYGINWKDKPGDGAKWLTQMKSPYMRVGEDASGKTGVAMGVTGVPETYLIDADGRIRFRHEGPLSEEIWEKSVLPLLAKLNGEG